MATYPDRDDNRSKGGSTFIDNCHCDIDPRERHSVRKLDRYELEDRYLRLLDEINSLKKLSVCQEDKIKRLATKLMRFGANPRACIAATDNPSDDCGRLSLLEAENSKLRDKVSILKNQLINQKIYGRSPSRSSRNAALGTTSGTTSCRSESSRLKGPTSQCTNAPSVKDDDPLFRIQELEAEKIDMLSRIAELEVELASFTNGNRRDKVAENIGYIRFWRQIKRQNENLIAAQTANEMLNQQICQLKSRLEESQILNKQMKAELDAERQRATMLDKSISEVKDSRDDLKEKDERISDLTNEMGILHQHNRELVALSSKFDKVERENVDLKRKLVEHQSEQQNLKDELTNEKTNMAALRAANEQLIVKLHELQTNIDVMTIKLMGQNERRTGTVQQQRVNKTTSTSTSLASDVVKSESIDSHPKESLRACDCNLATSKANNQREKSVQTLNETLRSVNITTQTDKLIVDSANSNEQRLTEENYKNKHNNFHQPQNVNSLSREGMLRLLEQVQISAPLETQNANRKSRSEIPSLSVTLQRRASNFEQFLFGDSTF